MYTGWKRRMGSLIFIGHSSQKHPTISGSFAERDLQLKASYPICIFAPLYDKTHSCVWYDSCIYFVVYCAQERLLATETSDQTSPIISSSFAERDLQFRAILSYASSPPSMARHIHAYDSTHVYTLLYTVPNHVYTATHVYALLCTVPKGADWLKRWGPKREVAKRGVWPTETSLEHVFKNHICLTYVDWLQNWVIKREEWPKEMCGPQKRVWNMCLRIMYVSHTLIGYRVELPKQMCGPQKRVAKREEWPKKICDQKWWMAKKHFVYCMCVFIHT